MHYLMQTPDKTRWFYLGSAPLSKQDSSYPFDVMQIMTERRI